MSNDHPPACIRALLGEQKQLCNKQGPKREHHQESVTRCSFLAAGHETMRSAETVALKTAFTIQLGYRSLVGCLKVNRSSNTPRQATTQRTRLFVPVIKVVTFLKQSDTE